jgi:hypothetical protein
MQLSTWHMMQQVMYNARRSARRALGMSDIPPVSAAPPLAGLTYFGEAVFVRAVRLISIRTSLLSMLTRCSGGSGASRSKLPFNCLSAATLRYVANLTFCD